VTDVSARKSLEEQLRQSQKMDVLGQLAGGVAHDFNNLLTVILGFGEILLLRGGLPTNSRQIEQIEAIVAAGKSAASLTRQLLTFSRRQIPILQDVDLNATIEATSRLLRRLIGDDISLVTTYGADLGHVRADTGQIEQILMNLSANARDAMSRAGSLVISTAFVTFAELDLQQHPAARVGDYVVISVRDTGTGMDAATQARIFEPFFTTKDVGMGTGLGLAAVYGIVEQQKGFIEVESILGNGTTIQI
jgi:two-component system cell cycle sensor histidine kinase/response regulator CckA